MTQIIGAWFAVFLGSMGCKIAAFLITWTLLGVVCGYAVGTASHLGGPDDHRNDIS